MSGNKNRLCSSFEYRRHTFMVYLEKERQSIIVACIRSADILHVYRSFHPNPYVFSSNGTQCSPHCNRGSVFLRIRKVKLFAVLQSGLDWAVRALERPVGRFGNSQNACFANAVATRKQHSWILRCALFSRDWTSKYRMEHKFSA